MAPGQGGWDTRSELASHLPCQAPRHHAKQCICQARNMALFFFAPLRLHPKSENHPLSLPGQFCFGLPSNDLTFTTLMAYRTGNRHILSKYHLKTQHATVHVACALFHHNLIPSQCFLSKKHGTSPNATSIIHARRLVGEPFPCPATHPARHATFHPSGLGRRAACQSQPWGRWPPPASSWLIE